MIRQKTKLFMGATIADVEHDMNSFLDAHPAIEMGQLALCSLEGGRIGGGFSYAVEQYLNGEMFADVLRGIINEACGGLDVEAEINLCTVNGVVYAGNSSWLISDNPVVAGWVDAMNILLGQRERVNTRWGYDSDRPIYELPPEAWDEPAAAKTNGPEMWALAIKQQEEEGGYAGINRQEDKTRIYQDIENGKPSTLRVIMAGEPPYDISQEELNRTLNEPGTWKLA